MIYLLDLADRFFSALEHNIKVKYYTFNDIKNYPIVESIPLIPPALWASDRETGKDICSLIFTFNEKTILMGDNVKWALTEADPAWNAELHGFAWLNHLKAVGLKGQKTALYLVENWIQNFSKFSPTAWSSKATSVRLCSFLTHNRWLLEEASEATKEAFLEIISKHAHYIKNNLCWHKNNLDIIKNVKAIIFSSCCLYEFRENLFEALDILKIQLEYQVLPDGFHISRNPSTQAELSKDLQDIVAILNRLGSKIPPFLTYYNDKVAAALLVVTLGGSQISTFGENKFSSKESSEIIKKIENISPEKMCLNYSGFSKLARGVAKIVFYSGPYGISAKYAHKTADLCSFNLSIGNKIVFTNIKTAPKSHFLFNRTKATDNQTAIEVNRDNNILFTSNNFKHLPKIKSVLREEEGLGIGVTASHNSYKKLGIITSRTIFLTEDGNNIIGEDFVKTKNKTHTVKSYFQLGDDVSVKQISDKSAILNISGVGGFNFSVKNATIYLIKNETIENGALSKTSCIVIQGVWNRKVCKINWSLHKRVTS